MILNTKQKLFALVLLIMLLIPGCQKPDAITEASPVTKVKPISKSNFLLGTIIEISVFNHWDETTIDKAFNRISEIESKMTINNAETSEIIALNDASGKKEVKLSPDTFFVLEKGKQYSELFQGKFDITIGPVVKLWNIGTEYAAVPEKSKLDGALKLVDYNKLILNKENFAAKLEEEGMKVDLGAIAKGYAADEVARVLKENEVKHAIVNLGGNIMTLGGNPNGGPWKIGIQDPFNPRGDFLGIVSVEDKTVVTSGTYERYFEENGKKYHHILNADTGYPIENNLYSVSIITNKSIDGDGLSTTALLIGLDEGLKLIENLEHTEAIFVTKDKQVYVSSGLKNDFIITKPEFKLTR